MKWRVFAQMWSHYLISFLLLIFFFLVFMLLGYEVNTLVLRQHSYITYIVMGAIYGFFAVKEVQLQIVLTKAVYCKLQALDKFKESINELERLFNHRFNGR